MNSALKAKHVLINVSGPDHPGISSSLFKIISDSGTQILDIGQSVTHGLLSLSIVLDMSNTKKESDGQVIKELLFCAHEMGLSLTYKVVDYDASKEINQSESFILSCVSVDHISSSFVHNVSSSLAKHNINIKRVEKVSPGGFRSIEILTKVPKGQVLEVVKKDLLSISNDHKVDVAFLKDDIYRRSKRLIVFDMDSTLIQVEVIDELAEAAGVGEEIKRITEQAMNGEIDFSESLKQRVSKLKGLDTSKMQEVLDKLPLTPGTEEFIKTVKMLGYKVAVISGGFTFFANALKEKLDLDYAFANELEIVDKQLTGKVKGKIVDAEQKAALLSLIAQQENISTEQVVAVGDGANDLPMLSLAGLGIAFHAKDIVKEQAQQHMSHGPMTSILYFLGIPGTDTIK